MFNVYNGTKLVASFSFLRDARQFISKVFCVDFKRQGFDLISVTFPRNLQKEPQRFTFGTVGIYRVISISKS